MNENGPRARKMKVICDLIILVVVVVCDEEKLHISASELTIITTGY